MNEAEREQLDKHKEALFGTDLNPQIGLVPIVTKLALDVQPILKLWGLLKWPAGILGLILSGWLVTKGTQVIERLPTLWGGGQ